MPLACLRLQCVYAWTSCAKSEMISSTQVSSLLCFASFLAYVDPLHTSPHRRKKWSDPHHFLRHKVHAHHQDQGIWLLVRSFALFLWCNFRHFASPQFPGRRAHLYYNLSQKWGDHSYMPLTWSTSEEMGSLNDDLLKPIHSAKLWTEEIIS